MEEEKASAYYQEMVKKGGGAARQKHGLGFNHASVSSSSKPDSNLTFVKSDPLLTSQLEKESTLASVRSKLQKQSNGAGDRNVDWSYRKEEGRTPSREHGRDRDRDRDRTNHRSKIDRSRSRSWSPGCRKSRYTGTHADDDADDGHGYDGSSKMSSSRRRHQDSRNRSIEAERDTYTRNGECEESGRSRFVKDSSPESHSARRHRIRDHHHQSRPQESRGTSLSSDKKENAGYSRNEDSKTVKKEKLPSHSTLIPGYDNMTAAEKVKARMKFQLSETIAKDSQEGMSSGWERFDFNRDAPLDDDAKLDHFGDGTGALDDIGFLQNTGSTLLSSASQARREAQIQAAHDAAIFGPPAIIAGVQTERFDHMKLSVKELHDDTSTHEEEPEPALANLVNEQVLSMQQGSWRQRAMKLKQERAANAAS